MQYTREGTIAQDCTYLGKENLGRERGQELIGPLVCGDKDLFAAAWVGGNLVLAQELRTLLYNVQER